MSDPSSNVSPSASTAAIIARIARIGVSDYRAFPSGPGYEWNLGADGRNLLLFGENGSGKTSLFRAIRDLMATQPPPDNFSDLRHFFAPGTEGFISVGLTAGGSSEFRWDYGDPHPRETAGQPYALFAERCRFLDYRSLLETNFVHRTPTPNLYKLLVNEVLRDLPVIIDGKQERLGNVHQRMLNAKLSNHRSPRRLKSVDRACAAFSQTLVNHLPEVVKEGNRILDKMGKGELVFDLQPKTVQYNRYERRFVGEEIALAVKLYGQPLAKPQLFLNEARLTALALAIYLGSARLILQSLASSGDETTPVRLLVLDDVLIGLDLANRIPVLKVLNDEFSEWQVLLFTYDRVWFDLAREYTEHTGRWACLVLREIETVPGQPGRPHVVDANIDLTQELLTKSESHFVNGDLMATAVYLRAAFETRIKTVCRKHGVKVAYEPDPKNVSINQLWEAIVDRQKKRQAAAQAAFMAPSLMQDVETVRSTVLNRLSHSGTPTLVTSEL